MPYLPDGTYISDEDLLAQQQAQMAAHTPTSTAGRVLGTNFNFTPWQGGGRLDLGWDQARNIDAGVTFDQDVGFPFVSGYDASMEGMADLGTGGSRSRLGLTAGLRNVPGSLSPNPYMDATISDVVKGLTVGAGTDTTPFASYVGDQDSVLPGLGITTTSGGPMDVSYATELMDLPSGGSVDLNLGTAGGGSGGVTFEGTPSDLGTLGRRVWGGITDAVGNIINPAGAADVMANPGTDFSVTQAYPSMDTAYTDPTAMAYMGVTPPGEEFGSSYAGPNTMGAGTQPVGKYGQGSYMGTMGMGPPGANEVRPDYWADPVDISQLDKVETTPWGKLFEGTGLVKDWAGHDYKSGVIEQLATGDQTALTAEEADAWKGYDLSQHLTDAGKIAANIGVVPLQTLDEMKDVMTSAAANKDSILDRLPAYISAVPSAIAAIPTGIKAGVANLNPAVPERFTAFNDLLQSGDLSTDPESIQEVISQVDTFSSPLASPDITAQAAIDDYTARQIAQDMALPDEQQRMLASNVPSVSVPAAPVSAPMAPRQQAMPAAVTPAPVTAPSGPSAAEIERQKQAAVNARLAQQATARQQQQAQAAAQAQAAQAQAQAKAYIDFASGRDRGVDQRQLAAAQELMSQIDTFGGGRITGDRNGGAAGALGGYRGDPVGRQAAIESRGGGRNGGGRDHGGGHHGR